MKIQFKGKTCFTIKSENGTQIILNPHSGLKDIGAKIVTLSRQNQENLNISGNPQILDWPGEYEIDGIAITGIAVNDQKNLQENIAFKILVDQMRVCYLGNFNIKANDEILEKIGNVDILLIPVGGKDCLSAEQAKEIIEEIDPRIIIPMQYKSEENLEQQNTLGDFLKKMGQIESEPREVFEVSKSQLPEEKTDIIVLARTE